MLDEGLEGVDRAAAQGVVTDVSGVHAATAPVAAKAAGPVAAARADGSLAYTLRSPDGTTRLVVRSATGTTSVVGTVGTDEEVGALSGDAHLVVTATRSRARVWDVATHRVVGTFATGGRTPMHFTPDGILFKAPQGGQAQIRRTDGRVVRTFSGDLDPEFVSPLGTLLVGETTSGPATDSPQVVVYRTTAGTPLVRRVPLPAGTDMCLASNAFGPRSFVMTCLLKSTGTSTPAARAYEVDYSGGAARPLSPPRPTPTRCWPRCCTKALT